MKDQTWNFLVPGSGTHTFRWTGSNAFIDSTRIKMNKSTHPNLSYVFSGVRLLLSRNPRQSVTSLQKWRLQVDGRLVEEYALTSGGSRNYGGMQEGSYTIATHFTPSVEPQAVFVFLSGGLSHNVSLGHDQATGRVELTVDGEMKCGRDFKFFDSGIKLDFEAGGVPCQARIKTSMLSFNYKLFVNEREVKPCHTKAGGAVKDFEPVEIEGPRKSVGEEGRQRRTSVGWNAGMVGEEKGGEEGKEEEGGGRGGGEEKEEEKHELRTSHRQKSVSISASSSGFGDGDNDGGSGLRAPPSYDSYTPTLPRGVAYDSSEGLYTCGVTVRGRFLNLGAFDTVEEAAQAYQEGLRKYSRK